MVASLFLGHAACGALALGAHVAVEPISACLSPASYWHVMQTVDGTLSPLRLPRLRLLTLAPVSECPLSFSLRACAQAI